LVVDDLPDVRATVVGMLSDEGYDVQEAATYDEAVDLLQKSRFHAAILDIRLEESDVENETGLQLMDFIHQKDPTIVTVMLTGYAQVHMIQRAYSRDSQGKTPAYSFLQKSEIKKLPAVLTEAFTHTLRINHELMIEDDGAVLESLAKGLRFQEKEKPEIPVLIDEIDELLRKLFFECERIQVTVPQRGYSAAAVFKVIPWYMERGLGEALIVKIGERGVADREVEKYREYVQGMVGGHRVPKAVDTTQTQSLTGILYTFAGLGFIQDFSVYFESADKEAVQAVLRNLYLKTCRPWQRNAQQSAAPIQLKQVYLEHLWLTDEKLTYAVAHMMGKRHPFSMKGDGQILLGEDNLIPNPADFVRKMSFEQPVLYSIIHGDLQGYNVLVDQHEETWLIDFANTTKGPLAQDYALFETYLLISVALDQDWQTIYQWHLALFSAGNLTAVPLSPTLAQQESISKAHAAVLTIRRLAFGDAVFLTEWEYLTAVLFNSLKLLTIMNLPAVQRDFALIAAALVAERLIQNS
ncbi:MAG: response regulator, partial [Anaerolineae bacterium]|nr:response regulator [Anaerolineae bacterium]